MLRSKAPFRIAEHILPDWRRHGDLFVDLPERDTLLTFEMDGVLLDILKKDFVRVYLLLSDPELEPLLRRDYEILTDVSRVYGSVENGDLFSVPLRKKSDHRKMYMTYSGQVETRGFVKEFTRGKLDGFGFAREDSLLIVEHN